MVHSTLGCIRRPFTRGSNTLHGASLLGMYRQGALRPWHRTSPVGSRTVGERRDGQWRRNVFLGSHHSTSNSTSNSTSDVEGFRMVVLEAEGGTETETGTGTGTSDGGVDGQVGYRMASRYGGGATRARRGHDEGSARDKGQGTRDEARERVWVTSARSWQAGTAGPCTVARTSRGVPKGPKRRLPSTRPNTERRAERRSKRLPPAQSPRPSLPSLPALCWLPTWPTHPGSHACLLGCSLQPNTEQFLRID